MVGGNIEDNNEHWKLIIFLALTGIWKRFSRPKHWTSSLPFVLSYWVDPSLSYIWVRNQYLDTKMLHPNTTSAYDRHNRLK